MINNLIKENASLRRRLERAATKTSAGAGASSRGIASLTRKVQKALSGTTRRSKTATKAKTVRKPASPEVAAKRLEALAKARAARAANKAAATS
jgi:hypothetical protein